MQLGSTQAELAACQGDLSASTARVRQLQTQLADCRARTGLPDTGQTKCYDQRGAGIPCGSATCPGQDGSYSTGCPSQGRFLDNGDGTVTDNCTGLQWQKDTGNRGNPLTWCEALAYCENLSFAGHDDWRLPNVRELESIVDYGRFNPSIDPVFGVSSAGYWSSTAVAGGPGFVWNVIFEGGTLVSTSA